MKNKKIFFVIAVAAVIIFLFAVDSIKRIQTQRNKTDSERYIESIISKETYTIDQILSKASFDRFIAVTFNTTDRKKDFLKEDSILDQGFYIYPNEELVEQVFDILRKYKYSYAVRDMMLDENCKTLYGLGFRSDNDVGLILSVNSTEDENTHVISISVNNEVGVEKNYSWFEDHLFGFVTDADLSREIYQIFTEHTRRVSLQEVKNIVSENTGEMPWSAMFQYENFYKQQHINYADKDCYTVYEQRLEDSEKYLLTYVIYEEIDKEQEKKEIYQYIFKIELYREDGALEEVLYDDTERYNKDMKRNE